MEIDICSNHSYGQIMFHRSYRQLTVKQMLKNTFHYARILNEFWRLPCICVNYTQISSNLTSAFIPLK